MEKLFFILAFVQPETLYTIPVLACRSGMCIDPLKSEAIYKKTN